MDYMQEVQGAEEVSGMKTHKVLWFIFFGIIFFSIFLIVYLIFTPGHKNISDKKLIEGIAMEVGESDVINFNFDREEHGMWINFVGEDFVEITISSNPINLSLKINEIKEVDLDNDGVYDIRVKLVSIVDGKATIAIKRIDKEVCQENWECSRWENCHNGIQKRNCDDLNDCRITFNKPSEERECLEIEFVEDGGYFENGTSKSLNNTNGSNLTNVTTASNLTNKTNVIINNQTNATNNSVDNTLNQSFNNLTNLTVCPIGTYACYEPQGFFCKDYYDYKVFNPFCCPKECLKFDSKEQLCSARGYLYFTGNETHICKVQVYSPFNGANILCCISIEIKRDVNMILSTQD